MAGLWGAGDGFGVSRSSIRVSPARWSRRFTAQCLVREVEIAFGNRTHGCALLSMTRSRPVCRPKDLHNRQRSIKVFIELDFPYLDKHLHLWLILEETLQSTCPDPSLTGMHAMLPP